MKKQRFSVTLDIQEYSDPSFSHLNFLMTRNILMNASCIKSSAELLSEAYLIHSASRRGLYVRYSSSRARLSPREHSWASSASCIHKYNSDRMKILRS